MAVYLSKMTATMVGTIENIVHISCINCIKQFELSKTDSFRESLYISINLDFTDVATFKGASV